MIKYKIYLVTGPTGKGYVGQTCKEDERVRWREHIRGAFYEKRVGRPSSYFHKALVKHGSDSFIWEVLAEYNTKQEANQAEKIFIILLNTKNPEFGYNIKPGGYQVEYTEDIRHRMGESKQGEKHPLYRHDISSEDIFREYEACGNFEEVGNKLGINYLFVFKRYRKYIKDHPEKTSSYSPRKKTEGKQIVHARTVSTKEIEREYENSGNLAEAARVLGISKSTASKRLKNSGGTEVVAHPWERKDVTPEEVFRLYEEKKNWSRVSEELSVSRPTLIRRYKKYIESL